MMAKFNVTASYSGSWLRACWLTVTLPWCTRHVYIILKVMQNIIWYLLNASHQTNFRKCRTAASATQSRAAETESQIQCYHHYFSCALR